MEKQTYGVETILKRVQPDDYIKFNYELRDCQEDFGVNVTLNEKGKLTKRGSLQFLCCRF